MQLTTLPILSPETRAKTEALRGVGLQETHSMDRPTYDASYLFWGSRRHTPCTKPPKNLTYSIPRNEGNEGGVKRGGVPGDTSYAPNHPSILPILSPETRARKEALRGVGFQETHLVHRTTQASYLFYPQRQGL
jgi:hypothetical protein